MSDYLEAYKTLDPEKRQAVEALEGPLLVIAGPGTGKTHLLSVRAAHILDATDTPPEAILCLTFTESGAKTMRERIASFVGPAAYDMHISTYHAFGSELLRRYSEYFAEEPGQSPIDDLGIDATLRGILEGLPYESPLKSARAYLEDIKTFIADCKRALLDPSDIRQLAEQNQVFIDTATPLVAKHLFGLISISKRSVSLFEKLYKSLQDISAPRLLRADLQLLLHQCTKQLAEALELFQKTGKTTALTKWKNTWLAKDDQGGWILDGKFVCQKLMAASDIYEQYIEVLNKQHQFDYDDMIMRVVKGLENNSELRYTIQERYLYIMLDEFQDTNPAQLHLLKLLTDNPVHEGRPNIMAVGDDDQAIYAFQGADYSNMVQFTKLYRDVRVMSLAKNFRSHAHILHIAHNIAEQIEQRLHHSFSGLQKVLSAENRILPAAHVARHEFKTNVAEYDWVATEIEKLVASGLPASEIAVLAPKHSLLESLVPFLRRRKLPIYYEKREDILQEPLVLQLTQMSKLVLALREEDHGQADELWPEILSYPFWGIATTKLWEMSWQANKAKRPWALLLLKEKDLAPVALFFIRLGLMSHTEPVESIMDYLTGVAALDLMETSREKQFTSPFYLYYFGEERQTNQPLEFWRMIETLTQLRENLRNYKQNEQSMLLLQDFIGFVEAHHEAGIGILNESPYHEAENAVQLMTPYKAKGLEFQVVFVLACIDEVWGTRSRNRITNLNLPANLKFIRYGGATDDERLRLFFVALTRAKTRLYLTSHASTVEGRPTTRLKYLSETDSSQKLSPWLPVPFQSIIVDGSEVLTESQLKDFWYSRHLDALKTTSVRQLLLPRVRELQLSATHVNNFTDLVHGGPAYVYFNTLLKFPKSIGVSGQFGNAVHETLHWLHTQHVATGSVPSTQKTLKTFETLLSSKRLSQRDFIQQLERGRRALTLWLHENRKSFNKDDAYELDFASDQARIDDIPLTGKIDLLSTDKSSKTIHVADFKTGKPRQKWTRSDLQLHKYRQQLYFYKLLIEHSNRFRGFSVSGGSLVFIEPDSNDQITRPLTLTHDKQELERMRKLIGAVWQHIQSFTFPDTSAYSKDITGTLAFEDDLVNGKI